MSKTGRPSKLDAERKKKLFEALKRGATIAVACQSAGVSDRTVSEWIRRGEGRDRRKSTKEYAEFAVQVQKAIADSEMALLTKVQQGARNDWRAASWILERRFSERWASTQKVEVRVQEQMTELINDFYDGLESELPPETYEQVLAAITRLESRAAAATKN